LITRGENAVPTEPITPSQIKIEVDRLAEKETSTSKPEWKTSSPAKSTFPVKRVVEKRDTLYSLIREVYGAIDKELIVLETAPLSKRHCFISQNVLAGYNPSRSLSDLRLFGPNSIILGVWFALIINFNRLQGFSGGRIFANSVSPTGS